MRIPSILLVKIAVIPERHDNDIYNTTVKRQHWVWRNIFRNSSLIPRVDFSIPRSIFGTAAICGDSTLARIVDFACIAI
jgi:hypothetical protein